MNRLWEVSIKDSIEGFIKHKGQPLDKGARIFDNQMKNCPLGETNYFRIRQNLHTDEAMLISKAFKESGNLFDFSELRWLCPKVVFRPCREAVENFLQQLSDFLGKAGKAL